MDETEAYDAAPVETVGQTLRAAREAQGKSIEDIAAATRIPTRHLDSLEKSEWDKLPAPTYTMGFAKNYASELGLDRQEIGNRLREEMGGYRAAPTIAQNDYFAPTDPKRSVPIGLVAGVLLGLVVLAFGLNWLLNRDINAPDDVTAQNEVTGEAPPPLAVPAAAPNVVITATDAAWVDIRDGDTVLKQGELRPGETFEVPANALAPTISTAKPEALNIAVGTATAPTIGPAGKKVDKVSLKGTDLMRGPQSASAPAAAPSTPPATTAPRPPRPSSRPAPAAATPQPAPVPVEPAPSPATPNVNTAG